MSTPSAVRGSLPEIIKNSVQLYEGNLIGYFRVLWHATNLTNPYHNFRHMMHVTWLCHQACIYYAGELTPRQMRTLLVAALFHDLNHTGRGPDQINIEAALVALGKHVAPQDRNAQQEIADLIRATEFPYVVPEDRLTRLGQIMRDADMGQALSPAWIQQVVFGLAQESGRTPLDILKSQEAFLGQLKFRTEWAQELFPQSDIDAKIAESQELHSILVDTTVTV